MREMSCRRCIFNGGHAHAGIIIQAVRLAPPAASGVRHPNDFAPWGWTLPVSGYAFQSFKEKFYSSQKRCIPAHRTHHRLHKRSITGQTIGVWRFIFSSLFSSRKMSLAFGGFYCLNLQSSAHFSHWWLIFLRHQWDKNCFEFWRSWKTHQLGRRSMWINISHNPKAFESRTWSWKKIKKKKRQTEKREKINWSKALLK